jgi:hypothetical protein
MATATAAVVSGCGAPSKSDVLDTIRLNVESDATCTLRFELLSQLKRQHTSKVVCVSRGASRPQHREGRG